EGADAGASKPIAGHGRVRCARNLFLLGISCTRLPILQKLAAAYAKNCERNHTRDHVALAPRATLSFVRAGPPSGNPEICAARLVNHAERSRTVRGHFRFAELSGSERH